MPATPIQLEKKSRIFPPGVEACVDAVGKQDGDNAENGGKKAQSLNPINGAQGSFLFYR